MKVTVNAQLVKSSAGDGDTLGDLIDELRRCGSIKPDEVLASLAVDSREWGAQDMELLHGTQLDGLTEVSITTDDISGYARRILNDAAGMLNVLRQATRGVARNLRGSQPKKANRDLFQLLDAIQQFLTCLYRLRNTCVGHDTAIGSQCAALALMSASLDTIVGCQEREDWPSLASQLEHDLMPALDAFDHLVSTMMRHV
jgi:hypothetical protein